MTYDQLKVCLRWLATSSHCPPYMTLPDSLLTKGVGAPPLNTYNEEH